MKKDLARRTTWEELRKNKPDGITVHRVNSKGTRFRLRYMVRHHLFDYLLKILHNEDKRTDNQP